MSDEEHGVLHQKIKFNDRVYLVEQIDALLDAINTAVEALKSDKQDKLLPGEGVKIDGNEISVATADVVPNILRIKNINVGLSEGGVVDVDNHYHVYFATVTSPSNVAFSFSNIATLAGDNAYSIELWVKVSDPACHIVFSDEAVVHLSDPEEYRVEKANQTIHFAIRYFLGKIYVNKYFVG